MGIDTVLTDDVLANTHFSIPNNSVGNGSWTSAVVDDTVSDIGALLWPVYQCLPILPEAWKAVRFADEKYELLMNVIRNRPEWWLQWKDKVALTNKWIEFKEGGFTILLRKPEWNTEVSTPLPTIDECERIYEFLRSVAEKDSDRYSSGSNFSDLSTALTLGRPIVKTSLRSEDHHDNYYFNFQNREIEVWFFMKKSSNDIAELLIERK